MIRSIKKIHISFFSMLLALLLFGTVSYAWLSMSIINNLDNISIVATSGNELEISLDGDHYDTHIPHHQLAALFKDVQLDEITSTDGIHFMTGGMRPRGEAIKNIEYLSFDLYFRTTRPERYVYLVNNVNHLVLYDTTAIGTFVVSKGVEWQPKATFRNGPTEADMVYKDQKGIYYASDAVRISMIEQVDERNELDQRESSELMRMIYDPSENHLRGYAKPYGAYDYFELMTGAKLIPPTIHPTTTYQLTQFHELNPYQALDNQSLIAFLQSSDTYDSRGRAYYTGKVQVNIWIEGWDTDAFDVITKDRIKIQLQFKIAHSAPNE